MAPNRGGLPPIRYFEKTSTLRFHFLTNVTLSIGLLIILTRLWSKRMVFPTCILEILSKKSIKHSWKTTIFNLLKRKWLFILQNSWPSIRESSILKSILFSISFKKINILYGLHLIQIYTTNPTLIFLQCMKDPLVKILPNK